MVPVAQWQSASLWMRRLWVRNPSGTPRYTSKQEERPHIYGCAVVFRLRLRNDHRNEIGQERNHRPRYKAWKYVAEFPWHRKPINRYAGWTSCWKDIKPVIPKERVPFERWVMNLNQAVPLNGNGVLAIMAAAALPVVKRSLGDDQRHLHRIA